MAISRVAAPPTFNPISDRLRTPAPKAVEAPGEASFLDQLKGALDGVETGLDEANLAVSELASGQNVDLHGTMISMEKADIALRMTVSARDKFIGAYEQIMNMAL